MDEPDSSPSPGSRPLGPLAIVLVAGVLLAAAGVAYLLFRGSSGHGASPAGSVPGEVARKTCIVVVPFRSSGNSGDLAWLGQAAPIFLTLSLEDDPDLKVLTPERVFDLTKPASPASEEAEIKMARKGGASFLLRGQVSGAPGSAVFEASWVEVASEKERGRWTVTGIAEDSFGHKLDELAQHVRQELGLASLGSEEPPLASLVPVKEAPTRSFVEASGLLTQGDPSAALDKLGEALKIENFHLARFLEALAAAQRGDPQRAIRAAVPLSKLSRPLPARVTLLIPAILALYQSGNPRTAVVPLETFLARFPDEKIPLSWLGAIELFLLHEPGPATAVLQRCLSLDPSNSDALRLLGQAILESGQAQEAARLLQEYLKTHSDDDAAGLLLAKALRNSGRGDEALRAVDGVLARKPENIPAVVLKGSLLLDQRKPQEAVALYQKLAASSEARSRAEGKALGGRVALLMGHFHDGLRDLRGAVDQARQAKIPSLQGQYLMTLAQAQATLGRNQEALGTYAEVRNVEAGLDPNLMIINVMVSQKQYDTARSMLEDQIAHWKGKASVDFLEKLRSSLEGSIALEEGNYKDAVARLEAALPDRASASVKSESLGRALLETGNPGKAEAIFRRITEDPDRYTDPIGYVRGLARLGEACEKQGKKDEALRAYREVLSWWGAADYSLPEIEKTKEALKRLGG